MYIADDMQEIPGMGHHSLYSGELRSHREESEETARNIGKQLASLEKQEENNDAHTAAENIAKELLRWGLAGSGLSGREVDDALNFIDQRKARARSLMS